ncbi:oxaloacetate decarboxylase subunit alpha [Neomoorella mulderi]|uniref:2-oxoglutarate carboxylase large subunit n=1 Tax=Moorella mulderi DSM 14980 TaxID=1122241 RepID=A0A151AUJ2_9FIRM|nr:oxaloacetate decarboxylase subunit alpha [Moorella mulderi]KYH31271.1 2-oxoglutarate carboxylase large subunit [Moorella mulderi DSM 14980]
MPQKVSITDTTLRDGHQSLLATRLKTEDMIPIAAQMDAIGFYSLEVWGGATFDACMRFLNEDPWERLQALRQAMPRTKLQMLLRGQNLLGYRHYADDVVTEFVKMSIKNGIDILRIFDALNDIRNMALAMKVAKEEGGHVQATICYTLGPVYDDAYYLRLARNLADLGADSLCIKDMAGLLTPADAYRLVQKIKAEVNLPLQLHCHYTSGMAAMTYLKAVEAGADVLDTAMSPLALGTSQPATETMVAALAGTPWDTGLDLDKLAEIAVYFRQVRKKYREFDVGDGTVDANVLRYQIPGGMLSNFMSQLAQQNALDRLPEVLAEVPRVRADLGYPPLVTPSSQMVGAQAVLNVLAGERYKMVTREVKDYLRGLYGQPPVPVNEEIRRKIIGDEEPITCRPADLLEPQLPAARQEVAPYMEKEEDVLSYALFPAVAKQFLAERLAARTRVDYELVAAAREAYYPA